MFSSLRKCFQIVFSTSLFLGLFLLPAHAQFVINEVQSANNVHQDPCGRDSDWIEIANVSGSPANISGWELRTPGKPAYVFSSQILVTGGRVIVWADGDDCTLVHTADFKISKGGDRLELFDASGTRKDNVDVPPLLDEQSYGRFPDRTGAFERMRSATFNSPNLRSRLSNVANAGQLVINEVVTRNMTTKEITEGNQTYTPDLIEIYNSGDTPVSLAGLSLRNLEPDATTGVLEGTLWEFPANMNDLPGKQYLKIYATNADLLNFPVTDFKLSAGGGEMLELLNADDSKVDVLEIPAIAQDNSYGRVPDGQDSNGANPAFVSADWEEITTPTFGTKNLENNLDPREEANNLIISEVVPQNASGLLNGENDFHDWIEICNTGPVNVLLDGLRLISESNADQSQRIWTFPERNFYLVPGSCEVVFASGESAFPSDEYHAGFKIEDDPGSGGEIIYFENVNGARIFNDHFGEVNIPDSTDQSVGGTWKDKSLAWNTATQDFEIDLTPSPGLKNTEEVSMTYNQNAEVLRIWEVVTNNSNTHEADYRGEFPDWIEIHNPANSGKTVSLDGVMLRDDVETSDLTSTSQYWAFPRGLTMQPGDFLVVYASGQNLNGQDNEWRDVPNIAGHIHANFDLKAGGERLQIINNDGITVIDEVGVNASGIPSLGVDQSYGVDESQPSGVGSSLQYKIYNAPTPGLANQGSVGCDARRAAAEMIVINEVSPRNSALLLDKFGRSEDFIELYNKSGAAINLGGFMLEDPANPGTNQSGERWVLPNKSIAAGGYLLIFASNNDLRDPNDELHSNFTISSSGETINWLDGCGDLVQSLAVPSFEAADKDDNTWGTVTDGQTGAYKYYTKSEATPGTENGAAVILYGDVNNDGGVNIFDALFAAQGAVGNINLDSGQRIRADVDGNVGVTIFDALFIAQYSVGNITGFPVEN